MSDLLRINLNKGESRASRMERLKERGRWIVFAVLLVLLLGLNAGALHYNNRLGTLIKNRTKQIEQINEKIRALKQEGMNLSKADIQTLNRLERTRIFWAAKLRALATNVGGDMALTDITYRHDRFVIGGITRIYPGQREFDLVDNFTSKLQQDPVFSQEFGRVKLISYSREEIRHQNVVAFEIEAELPPQRAAEPLR